MQLAFDDVDEAATGNTVMLLHGLTSSRRSYDAVVPELVADGWRVLNVDLRGHGESDHGDRYRAADYAGDVAGLIEAQASGRAVVVGHSLGGLTASALAAAEPSLVAGLFLEDPPLFEGDDATRAASPAARFFPAFVAQIRKWQVAETSAADVATQLAGQPSPHGGTTGERLGRERIESRARALLAFDPAAMDAAIGGDMWVGYSPTAPMSCPVSVVAADPEVGAVFLPDHGERYRAAVPHATIETIDGQAHGIHDDPEGRGPYLAALKRFLAMIA